MYEWQQMDYGDAGSLVHERDPRRYSWGYFANDNLDQSGVGLFFWFESPAELLAFISNIETQILKDEKDKKDIQELITRFNLNKGITKNIRSELNNKLGNIDIFWWGQFSDLCSGKGNFDKLIINSFFDSLCLENKPETVTFKYMPQFIEFCKQGFHGKIDLSKKAEIKAKASVPPANKAR